MKAITIDGQIVYVGRECYKNITPNGWQPPKGGPKLYPIKVVATRLSKG